jgi:hypothetical protein
VAALISRRLFAAGDRLRSVAQVLERRGAGAQPEQDAVTCLVAEQGFGG